MYQRTITTTEAQNYSTFLVVQMASGTVAAVAMHAMLNREIFHFHSHFPLAELAGEGKGRLCRCGRPDSLGDIGIG